MLMNTRASLLRVATTWSMFRPAAPSTAARWLTISDTYSKKERVEEDRYMREQEKKFFEQKKKETANMQQKEMDEFQAKIAPAMAEAHSILKESGNDVSDKGLEALARWKLGL
ncbi:hypothetical protein FisN_33Hh043 [Fistulifera solaris]|uniref:Uncharacterized protein n=1 Tax=Fistulifera solaris TaxID=1519565 RepID=A0A1Z5KRQ4_FISSO|nr:hypothetical protein FisN_33Hh043 [Fistulifera solaris]|eukprot:GAX28681.1 hypothetical protein FisN_33Hh043 [Fistulifera solaris]